MPDDDLFFATAAGLSRLLRARKISAVELTRVFLDRLATLGPRYNALAELTPELALRQARRADQMFRRSGVASPLVGALRRQRPARHKWDPHAVEGISPEPFCSFGTGSALIQSRKGMQAALRETVTQVHR